MATDSKNDVNTFVFVNLTLFFWGERVRKYKYNGKEFDTMHGGNLYDYGWRNFDPAIMRWHVVDPLAENFYSLSPYDYCGGNPVARFDPDGRDWVMRFVNGRTEFFYDRDVKSQDDVDEKYGFDSGYFWLFSGFTITIGDKSGTATYIFYNDPMQNKYGYVTDGDGNRFNMANIIYGLHYTIFGTTDNSVNAETLHKNRFFGSSYIGDNNPKDYNGNDSYQYKPTWSPSEMAARNHDMRYDDIVAKGIIGTMLPKTQNADMKLIAECIAILKDPNSSPKDKANARWMILCFTIIP